MAYFRSVVVVGPQHSDTLPKSVFETLKDMGYVVHAVDEREMLGISYKKDIESKGRLSFLTRAKKSAIEFFIKNNQKFELSVYNRLAAIIEGHAPDLIITHSAWIPPRVVERLKKNTGAKIVCWFPDHPGNIGRQYIFASPYDTLFFKDKFLVDRARTLGLSSYYLPEACMPKWHKPYKLTEEEKKIYGCDITTAGNMYYYRAKVFEVLISKYGVKLWGPGFPNWLDSAVRSVHQGRSVTEVEKSKAFNGAKIVLNTFQGEVFGVNQRFFEIAGCGGFQICEHRDAVQEFFEIGKEIITFYNINDLLEKIEYYLLNPDERQKIADAAHARAYKEHSFENRLEKMLKIAFEK